MERGRKLLSVLATTTLLAFAGPCLAAEMVQTQIVNGTRVSFSVIPLERIDPGGPGTRRGTEMRPGAHRIVVQLTDSKSDRPVADAEVQVNFAERGFAGEERRLDRISSGGRILYETILDLPQRRATYRVLVHFRETGSASTREVEFEYRHHH